MRIKFVFTGGTIGCSVKDGVADVDISTADKILSYCGGDIDFDAPFAMLSENATPESLSRILNYMLAIDYENYDGVIVTHGSDTLAYTANLLGIALSWVSVPVVITAADKVMGDPTSNARDNIVASYNFICDFSLGIHNRRGAFAAWKNAGEQPRIYPAGSLLEASADDKFSSFCEEAAENRGGEELSFLKNKTVSLCGDILAIKSRVGLNCTDYNIKGKAAVLLTPYHSGTVCAEGGCLSFGRLAEMCAAENVPLYLAPAKSGCIYSSAKVYKNAPFTPLENISDTAAYVGLMLAFGLEDSERETVLRVLYN